MKRFLTLLFVAALASCGYHLGGLKSKAMEKMNTFSVSMFENYTTYPNVSMQLTTALTDRLQRDGTYRLASSDACDFTVQGSVRSVFASSLRTNSEDTYLSSEIGLTVVVHYRVIDNNTGKKITSGSVSEQGSYFNDDGNVQTARDSALSYATRKAAESIVQALTTP